MADTAPIPGDMPSINPRKVQQGTLRNKTHLLTPLTRFPRDMPGIIDGAAPIHYIRTFGLALIQRDSMAVKTGTRSEKVYV